MSKLTDMLNNEIHITRNVGNEIKGEWQEGVITIIKNNGLLIIEGLEDESLSKLKSITDYNYFRGRKIAVVNLWDNEDDHDVVTELLGCGKPDDPTLATLDIEASQLLRGQLGCDVRLIDEAHLPGYYRGCRSMFPGYAPGTITFETDPGVHVTANPIDKINEDLRKDRIDSMTDNIWGTDKDHDRIDELAAQIQQLESDLHINERDQSNRANVRNALIELIQGQESFKYYVQHNLEKTHYRIRLSIMNRKPSNIELIDALFHKLPCWDMVIRHREHTVIELHITNKVVPLVDRVPHYLIDVEFIYHRYVARYLRERHYLILSTVTDWVKDVHSERTVVAYLNEQQIYTPLINEPIKTDLEIAMEKQNLQNRILKQRWYSLKHLDIPAINSSYLKRAQEFLFGGQINERIEPIDPIHSECMDFIISTERSHAISRDAIMQQLLRMAFVEIGKCSDIEEVSPVQFEDSSARLTLRFSTVTDELMGALVFLSDVVPSWISKISYYPSEDAVYFDAYYISSAPLKATPDILNRIMISLDLNKTFYYHSARSRMLVDSDLLHPASPLTDGVKIDVVSETVDGVDIPVVKGITEADLVSENINQLHEQVKWASGIVNEVIQEQTKQMEDNAGWTGNVERLATAVKASTETEPNSADESHIDGWSNLLDVSVAASLTTPEGTDVRQSLFAGSLRAYYRNYGINPDALTGEQSSASDNLVMLSTSDFTWIDSRYVVWNTTGVAIDLLRRQVIVPVLDAEARFTEKLNSRLYNGLTACGFSHDWVEAAEFTFTHSTWFVRSALQMNQVMASELLTSQVAEIYLAAIGHITAPVSDEVIRKIIWDRIDVVLPQSFTLLLGNNAVRVAAINETILTDTQEQLPPSMVEWLGYKFRLGKPRNPKHPLKATVYRFDK